jgi:hypothetical protein
VKLKEIYKASEVKTELEDVKKNNKRNPADDFINDITLYFEAYDRLEIPMNLVIDMATLFKLVDSTTIPATKEEMNLTIKWLSDAEYICKNTLLLIQFTKGKYFYFFKQGIEENFKERVQKDLGLSYVQVNNYIRFFVAAIKYKRLLICGKPFTTIISFLSEIENKANNNANFLALITAPLKEFKVNDVFYDINAMFSKIKISD